MIGKYVSNVDSLIKKYFRKKRPLLVMILVGQAFLIGLLTFLCFTKDSSDNMQEFQASQSMILVCGFFKILLKVNYYLAGFLMRILGCGGDDEKETVKILSPPPDLAVDDDAGMKIIEAVLLLILLGLLVILVILTVVGKSIANKSEQTNLVINNEGDWEYSPSKKRDAVVKF